MNRGSCPDLDDMTVEDPQSKDSWLSAFNKVVRDSNFSSNTVSLGEFHSKPGLDSVFRTQSSGRNDATYISAKLGKSIMCNNHDILSLSRDDVMAMSLSDAHETLFQLRVEGYMMKKGFKRLRLWKNRFFILSGKILSYWEVFSSCSMTPRQATITR